MTTQPATTENDQPIMTFSVLAQYTKDVSFENPRILEQMQKQQGMPEVGVNVRVNAVSLGDDMYEVTLGIEASAKRGEEQVFMLEVTYGGVFNIAGAEADALQPFLLIECPRLLFPFARNIVADLTRDGGMPPLLLNPVDFVALYHKNNSEKTTH